MKDEFEVISHGAADYKVFVVNLLYRTPHIHKDFEICLILEGSVRLLSRGREYRYEKGALWVINPLESHELAADQPALILSLQVSPTFFASAFPQIEHTEFLQPPAAARTALLAQTFLDIARAYFDHAGEPSLRCVGLIFLFFDSLLQHFPHTCMTEKERQISANKAQRIRRISDYIDSHYSEKLLLTDVAADLGLTMSYLSHFFKASFGMSFQEYVMKLRCEKARQLLLLTDFSLLDISMACGFSDIKYFNKGFSRQFGCSPRQYRRQFQHEELAQQQRSMLSTQEVLSASTSRVILETYLRSS